MVGRNGISISPDCMVSELPSDSLCDLVWLPGGLKAAESFGASQFVRDYFHKHNDAGKLVAAICASPAVAFK